MNPDMQADDALVVAVELDPLQLPLVQRVERSLREQEKDQRQ